MEFDSKIDKISITEKPNLTKIEIEEPDSLIYFYNAITSKLPKKIVNDVNPSYIYNKLIQVNKGVLYVINKDNAVYNIFYNMNDYDDINFSKLAIDKKEKYKDGYKETTLELLNGNQYKLTKKVNDSNNLENNIKIYVSDPSMVDEYIGDRFSNHNIDDYVLSKKQALNDIVSLLEDVEKLDGIDEINQLSKVYDYIGIIPDSKFYPVVSDDSFSISLDNENKYAVIRNKTREVVGIITVDSDSNYYLQMKKDYRDLDLNSRILSLYENFIPKQAEQKVLKLKKDQK